MIKENNIILISNNNLLYEQFKIEGISIDFSSNINEIIDLDYELIIINNISLNLIDIKLLQDYCKKGGTIIIIKPNEIFLKSLGLIKKDSIGKEYLRIGGLDFQISKLDIIHFKEKNIILKTKRKKPAIFEVKLGSGKFILICFGLDNTIFNLSHGKDVVEDYDNDGLLSADDGRLVENSKLLIPQVDILRRFMVELIQDNINMPLPRIWYFPYGKKSAIILTIDSDTAKKYMLQKINDLNIKNNIKVTTFLRIIDKNIGLWRYLKKQGYDIQLHPIVLQTLRLKFLKILFFKLQIGIVNLILNKRVIGIRNHALGWGEIEEYPVWMSLNKIEYDSTLGSNYTYGYCYGTGLPYFLRDKSYKSLDVLEIPLHIMDHLAIVNGYKLGLKNDKSFIKTKKLIFNFIDNCLDKYPSYITFDFHYYYLMDESIRDLYLKIINYAKKNNILLETMSHCNSFWRSRFEVDITNIKFIGKNLSYKIISEDPISGFTQILPSSFKNKKIKSILINNQRADSRQLIFNKKIYNLFSFNLQRGISKIIVNYS